MDDQIQAIRAFNRHYSKIIGLLNESLMNSGFTLAEARVIYETGKRQPVTAAGIADVLDMDRGQLSRLIANLVRRSLLSSQTSASDKRATALRLTAAGETACGRLNTLSDAAVLDQVSGLTPKQCDQLVSAMQTITGLLPEQRDAPAELRLRPHRLGELGWLIQRQAVLYNQEFSWNAEFEALIAGIYCAFEQAPETPPKKLWIAELNGRIAGSIFVQPHAGDSTVAQLRMLFVEPAARGQGVGERLVTETVAFARKAGYRRIMLWTQASLAAARRLYERAGFRLESAEPNHAFGVELTSQILALDLAQ